MHPDEERGLQERITTLIAEVARWKAAHAAASDTMRAIAHREDDLKDEIARLRSVVESVSRQTNQLMDGTDFFLLPGQVLRDARAALEDTDA